MHVPYRNSKLTYLLQDALGGVGCKTLLFAQISPESPDVHETYSTLAFAARVANVSKGKLRPNTSGNGNANTPAKSRARDVTPPPGAEKRRSAGSFQAPPDASPLSQASDSVIDTSLLSPLLPSRNAASSGPGGGRASSAGAASAPSSA